MTINEAFLSVQEASRSVKKTLASHGYRCSVRSMRWFVFVSGLYEKADEAARLFGQEREHGFIKVGGVPVQIA